MKKSKLISFSAFNKKESLWQQLLVADPLKKTTHDTIRELLNEPELDHFLSIKLRLATTDTIDLIAYLINHKTTLFAELPILDTYQNPSQERYVREAIFLLCQKHQLHVEAPQKPFIPAYNEDLKRTSLLEMLDISEKGDLQTAALITELMEAPESQILDMIDYIGNFDDLRIFNLLKFFAIADSRTIVEHTLTFIGTIITEPAFLLLVHLLKAHTDVDSLQIEIMKALQKHVYSEKLDLGLITPYFS